MSTPDTSSRPYGLSRPTVTDAHDAVHRVHGHTGPEVWEALLHSTGLSGRETDEASLNRLLDTMTSADAVSRLCAHALRIRLGSYTHLAAAHAITRSQR